MKQRHAPARARLLAGLVTAVVAVVGCGAAPRPISLTLERMTVHPSVAMVKLEPGAKEIKIPGRIEFQTGRALLRRSSHALLDQVAEVLKNNPQVVKLEIQGHTDAVGAPEANQKLSQQRAEAVRAYLIQKGTAADRLDARGYGDQRPISSNDTPQGRAKNRRVEFHIVGDRAVSE